MTKGNRQKGKESLVRQPAARQSGSVAIVAETEVAPAKALKRGPGVLARRPIASAAEAVQTVPPATASKASEVSRLKVSFVFPVCECRAKSVFLSGDFNGWSPNVTPMERYDDGHWEATIELTPGRYEYKFVRDGEWMPDLLARENVLNAYGTLNSVIEVRAS